MELFIPSLFVLLIAGILAFALVPRLSVPIILLLSLVILMFTMRKHMYDFAAEYRYSTWQYQLRDQAPQIIIGITIVIILFSFTFITDTGVRLQPVTEIPEPAPLPAANTATNIVTSTINSGIRGLQNITTAATNAVTNATNTIAKAVNTNTKKNNTSAQNLSALITTPKTTA